jgi:hypothetical protein
MEASRTTPRLEAGLLYEHCVSPAITKFSQDTRGTEQVPRFCQIIYKPASFWPLCAQTRPALSGQSHKKMLGALVAGVLAAAFFLCHFPHDQFDPDGVVGGLLGAVIFVAGAAGGALLQALLIPGRSRDDKVCNEVCRRLGCLDCANLARDQPVA